MRDLNQEEKDTLSEFAGLMMSNDDLANVLEMPKREFRIAMLMEDNEIFRIVTKARLITESKIRKGIIDMAERGSTPAQTSAEALIRNMKKDNV